MMNECKKKIWEDNTVITSTQAPLCCIECEYYKDCKKENEFNEGLDGFPEVHI